MQFKRNWIFKRVSTKNIYIVDLNKQILLHRLNLMDFKSMIDKIFKKAVVFD